MATLNFTIGGASKSVPVLGTDGKLGSTEIPTHLHTKARKWYNNASIREKGVWYKNNTTVEMEVHIYSNNVIDGSFVNIQLKDPSGIIYDFHGNSMQSGGGVQPSRVFGTCIVPGGWQYCLNSSNFNTRTVVRWYELY